MKPNWQYAPTWANYLAMDPSGEWWWYEFEPTFDGAAWWSHKGGRTNQHVAEMTLAAATSLEARL